MKINRVAFDSAFKKLLKAGPTAAVRNTEQGETREDETYEGSLTSSLQGSCVVRILARTVMANGIRRAPVVGRKANSSK